MNIADPGVGSEAAPVGTRGWAEHLRLKMQSLTKDLPKLPKHFWFFVHKALEHRAWTLMNKPDGSTFATFDEFCSFRQPWGLGKPWSEIRPHMIGVISERDLDLVTVAPAQPGPGDGQPGPGRGHKKTAPPSGAVSGRSGHTREEQLRAIAERAPEPARELYRRGLLGQKEAAKLGPKNPTPEDAERVTRIARDLAEEAKKLNASTEPARKQAQQALNAKARTLLGVRQDRVAEAIRAIERCSDEERERVFETARERGWMT